MSIRGGRGPREDMAAPVSNGGGKRPNGYQRTGRYGRGPGDQRRYDRYGDRGGGLGGFLRFVAFVVVLAVVVLVALTTFARPIVRLAIVPWAEGNPGALRIGFVQDLVREDLGDALTRPAGGRRDRGRVHRRARRHARHRWRRASPRRGSSPASGPSCSRPASTSSPPSSRPAAMRWP